MEQFDYVLLTMTVLGAVVFAALFFIDAGYGKMISAKWGPTLPGRWGWMLMEMPVLLVITYFWVGFEQRFTLPYLLFYLLFALHYVHRSFVFPLRMNGRSRMPVSIVLMSVTFNLINGYIQGYWLFRLAPQRAYYDSSWILSPAFMAGTVVFLAGMYINRSSDEIVRNLRQPGDTRHYLPKGGLYNYVTSANYFGEIVEWLGWAILTWSGAGLVFFWFTCANLIPRSNSIYHKYQEEFPDQFDKTRLKRILPYIY